MIEHMEQQSILFEIIQRYDIFEKLLKNDVTIYGSFVRHILFEGMDIKELANHKYGTIHCYAKTLFIDIIERDLHDYIIDKVIYKHTLSTGNMVVSYLVKFANASFRLEVLYVRSIVDFKPIYFEKDLQCIINIDGLCINRTGVYAMELFKNAPFLFGDIMQHIYNKRFIFKTSLARLSDSDKEYLLYLTNEGYINNQSKMKYITNTSSEICSICYENDDEPYVQLECGHIYHKSCIQESIRLFFNDKDKIYYQCPYCAHKFIEVELL